MSEQVTAKGNRSIKTRLSIVALACVLSLGCLAWAQPQFASAADEEPDAAAAAEEAATDEASVAPEKTTAEVDEEAVDEAAAAIGEEPADEAAPAASSTYIDMMANSGFPTEGRFVDGVTALPGFYQNSEENAANAAANQPRRYVDRNGFTVQPVPTDDRGFNITYLDADNRGCTSCNTL